MKGWVPVVYFQCPVSPKKKFRNKMTAIGPYSMATVPLYSPTRQICMGKVADCDSLLTVLSKYVPNYYECVVRAKMEHVYADPASKYTIFAFDRLLVILGKELYRIVETLHMKVKFYHSR